MFATIDALYEAAWPFIDDFDAWTHELHFETVADHLCYKCASCQEFEHIRYLFEQTGSYQYQSFVSGRRIAIIKLVTPIETKIGNIWFLELSDQKPDRSQRAGFDHIELYPVHVSLEHFIEVHEKCGVSFIETKHPHHKTYDVLFENGFKIRFEEEPLIKKIKRDEMR